MALKVLPWRHPPRQAPSLEQQRHVPPDTLYGLYQGVPLLEREWAQGKMLPDRVSIYQRPIVEDSDDDAIIRAIGEMVIHEFGHYFGLSEEEIEAIESRYWHGETDQRTTSRCASEAPAGKARRYTGPLR